MSDQEDDAFVLDVLKSGAFLVLETPLTTDALKRVRQDIIRKRLHKLGKCEKNITHKTATPEIEFSKWKYIEENLTQVGPSNFDNKLVSESSDNGNDGLKKKFSIEWTPELCEKFDNVLIQLGEGRCHPSEIHKLMNVPGLTKRQVSSHLQFLIVIFFAMQQEFY
ncbi:two-component response regulator ORR26-like [Helianthus annuus]|uniref:two-component response regulator ORR26-like n=1 Tax=Helianthus annuus TaxID=4232 RepID=UPI000B8FB108|nr:two-component response regulator ORR26-like [Helianthus annuus]